jgi:hypothetical protein
MGFLGQDRTWLWEGVRVTLDEPCIRRAMFDETWSGRAMVLINEVDYYEDFVVYK